MARINLSGEIFGRLTVVSHNRFDNIKDATMWNCVCECGNNTVCSSKHLRTGKISSCGCLKKEQMSNRFSTHKLSETVEYNCWLGIKGRCFNPKNRAYSDYGGRGIIVCDEWNNSFDVFFRDMGRKPSQFYSIERKDVNGNYEPSNCKWATPVEQARNRRNSLFFEYKDVRMSAKWWADLFEVEYSCAVRRIKADGIESAFLFYSNKKPYLIDKLKQFINILVKN